MKNRTPNIGATMPTPGLSLVGFLDQQQAMNHLLNACKPANEDPAALIAEWEAAKAGLGASPIANAGHPDIQSIPAKQQGFVQQVLAHPVFQREWHGAKVQLVEIDPLLAHQVSVDINRATQYCGNSPNPPTLDELLTTCLPLATPNEQLKIIPGQNSLLLKSNNLNVRILRGVGNPPFMGIHFGVSVPFVHVVRYNGRYYLFDGYHRAFGLRKAGVTHIPCVVRDVVDRIDTGDKLPAFPATLLESNNPPTLAHFTQQRAYRVSLRLQSRVLSVIWAEHMVPDE